MNPTRDKLLFQLALTKPATARATWLDRECGEDKALRARLEALLAAHDQPDHLVPTLAETVRPTLKNDLADAPDEAVGQTLGRYKLLERVGEGGCGVVYVAEQTEPVRRRVALKVIKLGMDTKQVVARFEAERQALAMMDHPNIAKVLDAGMTGGPESSADCQSAVSPAASRQGAGSAGAPARLNVPELRAGRPYFVMELVRGIKITDYCDQANLTTKERLDLFIKVCQAIQHAHQKGIIHRDIKPSNILVTLHDGAPVPKVIDFGIVTSLGWVYLEQGHVDEVATLCELAVQAARRKPDGNPRANASSIIHLGAVRLAQERHADAEKLLREGLPFVERGWADEAYRPYVLSLLGASLSGQKKYDDAEPLLQQSYAGLVQRQARLPRISTPRAGSRNPSNGWCNSTTPGANPPRPPSGNRNWPRSSKRPKRLRRRERSREPKP